MPFVDETLASSAAPPRSHTSSTAQKLKPELIRDAGLYLPSVSSRSATGPLPTCSMTSGSE